MALRNAVIPSYSVMRTKSYIDLVKMLSGGCSQFIRDSRRRRRRWGLNEDYTYGVDIMIRAGQEWNLQWGFPDREAPSI